MSLLNAALRSAFDLLLAPFARFPPIVGVVVVSAVAAVAMLLLFKWTSDQARMEAVKRRIHASLFEIRLFNDDLVNITRACLDILRHNAHYIRLTLLPLLVAIVPLVLAVAQLQFLYGYEPLPTGRPTLVQVDLEGVDTGRRPEARLSASGGISVEAGPVWIPSQSQLDWRISATGEGTQELTLELDGRTYTKTVELSPGVARRSPFRLAPGFWNQLLYPAEDPLPQGPVKAITVQYRDASVSLLGWETHWLILFLVLSIVFAFALRRPLGVNI